MMHDFYTALDEVFRHIWIIPVLIVFLGIGSYTDITKHKLYRKYSFIFMLLRAAAILIGYPITWMHILGAVAPFLLFTVVGLIFNMQVGGDVFFITALGFWISFVPVVSTIIIACIAGIIYGIAKRANEGNDIKEIGKVRAPFGPFMAFGCIATIVIYYVMKLNGFT